MDYPDVTLVLQMGLTTKDQYTHRLGRTARAGKEGSGLLICAPFELSVLQRELDGMPLLTIQVPAATPISSACSGRLATAQRNDRGNRYPTHPSTHPLDRFITQSDYQYLTHIYSIEESYTRHTLFIQYMT